MHKCHSNWSMLYNTVATKIYFGQMFVGLFPAIVKGGTMETESNNPRAKTINSPA